MQKRAGFLFRRLVSSDAHRRCDVYIIYIYNRTKICVPLVYMYPKKTPQIHQIGSILLWNICESPLIYSDRECERQRGGLNTWLCGRTRLFKQHEVRIRSFHVRSSPVYTAGFCIWRGQNLVPADGHMCFFNALNLPLMTDASMQNADPAAWKQP